MGCPHNAHNTHMPRSHHLYPDHAMPCNKQKCDTKCLESLITEVVQISLHQLLLNGNVTVTTAELLLGLWNKVI